MGKKGTIFTVVLILVVVLACAWFLYDWLSQTTSAGQLLPVDDSQTDTEEDAAGIWMPDFTVYDGAGEPVSLSDYLGTPVVLNFWASWCGPCQYEMPVFDEVSHELEGEVQFMMVNATIGRETEESAKAFLAETGYTFPVFYDTDGSALAAYGVSAYPTTFFIDADGVMVAYITGAIDREILMVGIDMILDTAETAAAEDAE